MHIDKSTVEIRTEAESNDAMKINTEVDRNGITEVQHHDGPRAGMYV